MNKTLAARGRGLHLWGMRALPLIALLSSCLAGGAWAQDADDPDTVPENRNLDEFLDPDEPLYLEPDVPTLDEPEFFPNDPLAEEPEIEDPIEIAPPPLPPAPDYSRLPPKAEREARLNDLFERLGEAESKERAELLSEEIWLIWQDSGSASVNYLLTRADAAQRKGQRRKARRFFDQMTLLAPDYAEAYARSSRLALDEEDYGRAITDATEALIREPRHFYAMWTLGNVLEKVGKSEEALEVYEEAHRLFPRLGGVKQRLDALRGDVLGDVL